MYIPEFNRIEDHTLTVAFMHANPFATLVSTIETGPFATHIPISAHETGGQLHLRGHVAKANPHWKSLAQDQESLIIFSGPHAYISPNLYEIRESVPTWNYAAVHVYGKGTVFTDEVQLKDLLLEIITRFDSAYVEQWKSFSDQYRSRMMQHIVGFEIIATRIETKFKLSQNRTKPEQEKVIRSLASSSDSAASGVATLMRERGLGVQ